ncbi:MAG: hypothetical protein WKG03_20995, partial [Telluria sp.]
KLYTALSTDGRWLGWALTGIRLSMEVDQLHGRPDQDSHASSSNDSLSRHQTAFPFFPHEFA